MKRRDGKVGGKEKGKRKATIRKTNNANGRREEKKRKKRKRKRGGRQRAQQPITAGRCSTAGPEPNKQRGDPEPNKQHRQTAPRGDAADPSGPLTATGRDRNPFVIPERGGEDGERGCAALEAAAPPMSGSEPAAVCSPRLSRTAPEPSRFLFVFK